MFGGTGLVLLSNGVLSKDYTLIETFSFSLLDIATAGVLGKGVGVISKFGLSSSFKTIYKTIQIFLVTLISETVKKIIKFYNLSIKSKRKNR